MTWRTEIIDDPQAWTRVLAGFAERPLYADGAWAVYKGGQGWRTRGVLLRDESGCPAAALLVQERKATPLGPRLRLMQGGPVFAPGIEAAPALKALLAAVAAGWPVAEMLYPAQALTPALEGALAALGFREVAIPGAGTVLLDLSRSQDDLRAALSKNWRHNLSRAEKRGLEVHVLDSDHATRRAAAERMAVLYDALTLRKGFSGALDPVALVDAVGEHPALEVIEIRKDGELLASRMGWMGGATALDLLAASSDAAKTTYANYLALWRLIERSRERGAARFDCGGIDPAGNQGVYNFKKGLSGEEVALGRLWLRTRPALAWPLAARALSARAVG